MSDPKLNCWQHKKCGREPGGTNEKELGVCPAALPSEVDGSNQGDFEGRCCWLVAGTCCEGEVQGSYAKKLIHCLHCDFLKQVSKEEGRKFVMVPKVMLKKGQVIFSESS